MSLHWFSLIKQMLYQRMYSDTDLWLGLKARQAKYKNVLGATKELSPVEDESVTGSKTFEVQPDQKADLGASAKKQEQVFKFRYT